MSATPSELPKNVRVAISKHFDALQSIATTPSVGDAISAVNTTWDDVTTAIAAHVAARVGEERERIVTMVEYLNGLTVYPDTATIMPQSMSHVKASTFAQIVRKELARFTPEARDGK